MNNTKLYVLGCFCYCFGMIIFLYEIYNIKKKKKLQYISFVRLFYAIIYGFSQGAIYTYVYHNGPDAASLNSIDFTNTGIMQLWTGFIMAVIAYVFINIGHLKHKRLIKFSFRNSSSKRLDYSYQGLWISSFILMFIGIISLLLWTKVYGGPIGILPYANALRAGRETGIYNPFSFFMKFCLFAMFASYIFWVLFMKTKRINVLVLFIISAISSFLYILANSGRMLFAIYFVILIFLREKNNSDKTGKHPNYLFFALIAIIALLIINAGEVLMGRFQVRSTESISFSFNIFKILREEFFFPIASFQTVLDAKANNLVGWRLPVDLLSGFFAWLPSRFRPEKIVPLEIVNTLFKYGTTIYGGLPTDFVTMCIYELGFSGIIVLPYCFGSIIRRLEQMYETKSQSSYYNIIYLLAGFYLMKAVGYADFTNIMSNIFYVVFGHLFVTIVCLVVNKNERNSYNIVRINKSRR